MFSIKKMNSEIAEILIKNPKTNINDKMINENIISEFINQINKSSRYNTSAPLSRNVWAKRSCSS